jgi:hypothetical protein
MINNKLCFIFFRFIDDYLENRYAIEPPPIARRDSEAAEMIMVSIT